MRKKSQPLNKRDDTVQEDVSLEDISLLDKREKNKNKTENNRNKLFDYLVNTKIFCYAALLVDYPEKNLFCGQIGEIESVIIDEKDKDSYLLTFIDYDHEKQGFAYCLVKKKHLLPLFSFDPTKYEKIEVIHDADENILKKNEKITINEIRNRWEELPGGLNSSTSDDLIKHETISMRFEIGRLVTIEVDIEQKLSNNESFAIQAGQIGIISDSLKTNGVEVTFWSMPFPELAVRRKELVEKRVSLSPNQNLESYATSSWKRTINIDENLLFPLYCEQLYWCLND